MAELQVQRTRLFFEHTDGITKGGALLVKRQGSNHTPMTEGGGSSQATWSRGSFKKFSHTGLFLKNDLILDTFIPL